VAAIFLTGFMAAGKTTVGRLAAVRLGVPFVELHVQPFGGGAASRGEDRVGGDVAAGHRGAASCRNQRELAGAAGDVQPSAAGRDTDAIEKLHCARFHEAREVVVIAVRPRGLEPGLEGVDIGLGGGGSSHLVHPCCRRV